MLTRRRPFTAKRFSQLSREVLKSNHPVARKQMFPKRQAVHRALAKSPSQRWPSAEAFAESLAPFDGKLSSNLLRIPYSLRSRDHSGTENQPACSVSAAEASLLSQDTDVKTTVADKPKKVPIVPRSLPHVPSNAPTVWSLGRFDLRFVGNDSDNDPSVRASRGWRSRQKTLREDMESG